MSYVLQTNYTLQLIYTVQTRRNYDLNGAIVHIII